MPAKLRLHSFVTLEKGKPPAALQIYGPESDRYLTPDYLRKGGECAVVKTTKTIDQSVRVDDGDTILLWDGSNAGEVLLGRIGILASTMSRASHTERFDSTYFFYALKHLEPYLKGQTLGSGIPHIDKEIFDNLEITEFELCEQSKIAEVLSTVDQAIEQTETLITKQQYIKIGLEQDLLTRGIDEHGSLRSEQTHRFKDSSVGRIPVEWSAVKLDRLVSRVGSGVTPKGGESVYTMEGVLFIRSQNVHFDGLRLDDVAYIPERIHLSMLRSEVFENDVLLNITGASIGRCCRVPKIDGSANVNQHVCTVRLLNSTEATAGFLVGVLASHIGQNQITQLNAGSNREGLNYQQIRSLVLPWPIDDSEFVRIYSKIRQMSNHLSVYRTSLSKLHHLKTGLMHDLLTGNRRVTALLERCHKNTN